MMKGIDKQLLKHLSHSYWFWAATFALLALAVTATYKTLEVQRRLNPYHMLPVHPSSPYSWSQIRTMKSNSVVKIKTFTSGMGVPGTDSNGTGWITKNGYIVTCYHVLSDKHYIINVYPYLNGRNRLDKVWYRAKVVKTDEHADLALLKIVHKHRSPLSSLSMTFAPHTAGTSRLILGFPGGTSLDTLVAYMGLPHFISNNSPSILAYSINGIVPMEASGLSGAPVLNHVGKVVGIIDIRHVHNQSAVTMIPVRYLKKWLEN